MTKDQDNPNDHEVIKVDMIPIGKVGYVANILLEQQRMLQFQ